MLGLTTAVEPRGLPLVAAAPVWLACALVARARLVTVVAEAMPPVPRATRRQAMVVAEDKAVALQLVAAVR